MKGPVCRSPLPPTLAALEDRSMPVALTAVTQQTLNCALWLLQHLLCAPATFIVQAPTVCTSSRSFHIPTRTHTLCHLLGT